MTAQRNTTPLPDIIVTQLRDEAAAAGDDKMVAICERVLVFDRLASNDCEDEQHDRDLEAIHRAIDEEAVQNE